MIKMINRITGTEMYVDDERVSEYKALGHHTTVPTIEEITRKEKISDFEKEIKRVEKKPTKKKV